MTSPGAAGGAGGGQSSGEPAAPPGGAVVGYFIPANPTPAGPIVPFAALRRAFRRHWIAMLVLTVGFGVLAIVAAAYATPKYRATVVVSIVDNKAADRGLGSLVGQFSGLASLAGIQLSGGGSRQETLALLRSREFTAAFIDAEKLMPVLFDARPVEGKKPPTMNEAVQLFDESIREIEEDKVTGLVKLSIRFRDRELAAHWASELIARANERARGRVVAEADRSIAYLNRELAQSTNIELQQAIYRLIQEQLNTKMLASVRTDYAYRVIDPAVVPDADRPVSPRRALYLAFGLLFGLLLGGTYAIWRDRRAL
jgi:uncharacterized protein involved in exopolysaccharide biosynthesis